MTSLADDLRRLRALKDTAEADGRDKKESDAEFKQHQAKVLDRMEAEEAASFRDNRPEGYLYSVVTKVKGQIEDRAPYVRWALENDEGIAEFLETWCSSADPKREEFESEFYDAITGTSVVKYKEDGHVMNQQARSHVDDGAPLPPGLTFRPDPYISMTKS